MPFATLTAGQVSDYKGATLQDATTSCPGRDRDPCRGNVRWGAMGAGPPAPLHPGPDFAPACLLGQNGAHGGTDGLSLVASIKVAGDGAAQRLAQKVAVQQIGQRLARLGGLLVEPVEILGLLLEKARVAWVSFSILKIAGYRACWPARFYPATRRKWCVAGQRSGSAPPAPQPPARPCGPAP